MASVNCPACAAEISDRSAVCPRCGHSLMAPKAPRTAAIGSMGGKLKATGTIVVTLAVIATVSGFWWGPALFLPGVALFMFGVVA